MLARSGKYIKGGGAGCFPPSLSVQFLADTPEEFRLMPHNGKHAAEE